MADYNESINEVLQKAPKNCKLTHHEIQKNIVNAVAWNIQSHYQVSWQWVLFNISWWVVWYLSERANGPRSSLCEKKKNIYIYIYIIERFLGIVHVASTTTLSLKYVVECLLCKHNLSLSKLRGQGYDGANNMQGDINGLKTLILKENKSAFYIHCQHFNC